MNKKKICICLVGNLNSVHIKSWLNYFSDNDGFEFVGISSHPLEDRYDNLYYHMDLVPSILRKFLKIPKISKFISLIFLKNFLRKMKVDLLHIHQLTNFGASLTLTGFKPSVISVWGSDVRLASGYSLSLR